MKLPLKSKRCCGGGDCGACKTCTIELSGTAANLEFGDIVGADVDLFVSAMNAAGFTTTLNTITNISSAPGALPLNNLNLDETATAQWPTGDGTIPHSSLVTEYEWHKRQAGATQPDFTVDIGIPGISTNKNYLNLAPPPFGDRAFWASAAGTLTEGIRQRVDGLQAGETYTLPVAFTSAGYTNMSVWFQVFELDGTTQVYSDFTSQIPSFEATTTAEWETNTFSWTPSVSGDYIVRVSPRQANGTGAVIALQGEVIDTKETLTIHQCSDEILIIDGVEQTLTCVDGVDYDCGKCQTCTYTVSSDASDLSVGGISGSDISEFTSNLSLNGVSSAIADEPIDADRYTCVTSTAPNGLLNAGIYDHSIMSATDPSEQYSWTPTDGSIEGTYDGDWTTSGASGYADTVDWSLNQALYENAGNGLSFNLNGVYDGVDTFSISNDYNFGSGNNDGVRAVGINFYDEAGAFLGSEPIIVANANATQSFTLSQVYDGVASFEMEIAVTYNRAAIQFREIGIQGTNLICTLPPVTGNVNITIYSCGTLGDIAYTNADGPQIATSTCDEGVNPINVCADLGYQAEWANSITACQKLVVNGISGGLSPYEVSLDGGTTFSTTAPFEIDQPKNGNVDLVIRDGNGCQLNNTLSNDLVINEDIWIEPDVLVGSNTAYNAGLTGEAGLTGIPAQHVTSITTTNTSGSESIQYLNNEIVRTRRGSIGDPNRVWLDNGDGVPIQIPKSDCNPDIEYSFRVRDIGTLETTDTLDIYLEWFDSSGSLISDTQVSALIDDFGFITVAGTETPPAGTTGVKARFESVTNADAEWHYIYLSQNLTFLKAVT